MEFDIQKLTTKEETEEDDEEDEDDEVGSHQKMITFETFFIKNERFNSHSHTPKSRKYANNLEKEDKQNVKKLISLV